MRAEAVHCDARRKVVFVGIADEGLSPFVHVGERRSPCAGHGFFALTQQVDEQGHGFLAVQFSVQTVDRCSVFVRPSTGKQAKFVKHVRCFCRLFVRRVDAGGG